MVQWHLKLNGTVAPKIKWYSDTLKNANEWKEKSALLKLNYVVVCHSVSYLYHEVDAYDVVKD